MSEVLVRQLQQVLAPWDMLEGDSADDDVTHHGAAAPTREGPSDPWGSATPQDALAHARAATTKLELSRAALALFTSNAGVFRPALVKVFRFLFDHIDELHDDVAHLKREQLAWLQGAANTAAAAAGPSATLSEGTPDEQNAVVSAYEKVRLTESRMAALVEEASVQRDHFKSQIEAQKRQQYHLEDLLQHQMELTQTLLDHRLRQELVGGGATSAAPGDANANASATTATVAGRSDGTANVSSSERGAVQKKDAAPHAEAVQNGRRAAERRDAAYVQRLITRADRELTLEKTEDQLRDLRVHQDELESKVQSLLTLNTKYARQCVELSARLSIIHENNIALAADVQLFQRDSVKEQQRSANLQHALHVARGIVLTTLQVQPGYHAEEMLDELESIDRTSANPQWKRYDNNDAAAAGGGVSHAGKGAAPATKASTTAVVSVLQLDPADEMEEALRVVPEFDFRRQLHEVLQVDDVDHGGKIKAALLRLLELEAKMRAHRRDGPFAETPETDSLLSAPPPHTWAPPYGLRSTVPRHLRSAINVPLLFLHPLLAEALVHELVTQRQRLLAFAQLQLEQTRAAAASANEQGGSAGVTELQQISAVATANSFVSFSNFIELFILVVWLNRADRYLPLLPAAERNRLEAEARVREDAHARRVSRLVTTSTSGSERRAQNGKGGAMAGGKIAAFHTSLWELRHVLHLVRPSTEAASLPYEGLQLTYALDVASQQTHAGPLTYAYGLTSRGTLCEVLFDVLRAEREALLCLCRAVDAAMVPLAQGSPPGAPGSDQVGEKRKEEEAEGVEDEGTAPRDGNVGGSDVSARAVSGWVPTVQFIRILLVLFPGYPVGRLEQLIEAAVAGGTVGTESPATLFYEALLPGRSLPGPTTAATTADTSLLPSTRFASLFYAAICDDALASMQVVEDSVASFVLGQQSGGEATNASTTGLGDVGGAASVTARQITSNAFLGLPRLESQQWVAGLRSVVHRWPRLRSTFADPGKGGSVAAARQEEAEADQVSSVARVSTAEVMPYLRQNVIVRRGLFANAETAAPTAAAAASSTSTKPAAQPDSSAASKALGTSAAGAAPSGAPLHSAAVDDGWTTTQQGLLQRWETQWAQFSNQRASAASATSPTRFGGPTRVSEYVELLRHLDPYRTRPWGSELVSRGSAVLHPLNYAAGWPDDALDVVRHDTAEGAPNLALKKAMTKVGRKVVKKAGGTVR